ncbi:hypothetical protein ACFSFY_06660 [Sporosarcina siberiensis]|uniref:Uncharacterized protein n=1 Tax=Sporosarcina siberiensis TaxID=1365606 RepID=A0ABW4SEL5_9BACL
MKIILNVLFHLVVISWYAYLFAIQMEDLIGGDLTGTSLISFLLRAAIAIVFSINLWKMTRRKKGYEKDSSISQSTK